MGFDKRLYHFCQGELPKVWELLFNLEIRERQPFSFEQLVDLERDLGEAVDDLQRVRSLIQGYVTETRS